MVLLFDTANAFCGKHTAPGGGCFSWGIYRMLLDSALYAGRGQWNNGGATENPESLQRERTSFLFWRAGPTVSEEIKLEDCDVIEKGN